MKVVNAFVKKLGFICCAVTVLALSFVACSSEPEDDFTEFTVNGDLSWLEGEWNLVKWEVNNHGQVVDMTDSYEYERLIIAGGTRDSVLTDVTKSPGQDANEYVSTVEAYLFANTLISNKVNAARNEIKHVREYATDPDVVFSFTYRKR